MTSQDDDLRLSRPVAVRFEGVSKRYGETVALDTVDLSIGAGELVALLGPNGAGKTTAISLMLGLRKPTTGRVLLLDRSPEDREARARCGAMLQESGLPHLLRVSEVVRLFRSHYPCPLPLGDVLAMANLEAKAGARVDTLSGGERQRLFFAVAICGDPDVLFLDEPTVGMDVESRHRFYDGIRGLAAAGRTILLTTHYLEEADQLADRVVVIDHGRIVIDGSPTEIKALVPGKRLTVESERALSAEDFAGLPLDTLELHNHRASLLTNNPVAVIEGLVTRAVRLTDLEVSGAALEDAFLALTARGRRA